MSYWGELLGGHRSCAKHWLRFLSARLGESIVLSLSGSGWTARDGDFDLMREGGGWGLFCTAANPVAKRISSRGRTFEPKKTAMEIVERMWPGNLPLPKIARGRLVVR